MIIVYYMFNCICFRPRPNINEEPTKTNEKIKYTNDIIIEHKDDEIDDDNHNNDNDNDNDNNNDDEIYYKLYNKLFNVSTEFNKQKQNIHNLMLMNDHKDYEISELKKELVSLKNNNPIEKPEATKSNNENTVLFLSVSNLTDTKKQLIKYLQENNTFKNIVIGMDDKYSNYIDEIQSILNDNNKLVILSYGNLIDKYTNTINNFNGKWDTNPSKLGAYDWFNESSYSYMWYIEDDVFSKDWDSFFNNYKDNSDDVIYKYSTKMPAWYYSNWKVGSSIHAINLAHLYVHRINKFFSKCLIESIKNENTTSHHELFVPYVIYKYNCMSSSLDESDSKYSTTNGTGDNVGFTKDFIDKSDSNLFHPVKIL